MPTRGLRAARLRPPSRRRFRSARLLAGWGGWSPLVKGIATLATTATGLAAVGALYFTNQSLQTTQRQIAQNGQQIGLAEQGQYTDRFGKAVEQLGSDKLDVRLGGIYALERLGKDSVRDAPTITEVLAAFARTHSACSPTLARPPADVGAVLTVLSRRAVNHADPHADLTKLCLSNADLSRSALTNLTLDGADLRDFTLEGTSVKFVSLSGADMRKANLRSSSWDKVDATSARLDHAMFVSSMMLQVQFNGAVLDGADMHDFSTTFRHVVSEKQKQNINIHVPDENQGADFSVASMVDTNAMNAWLEGSRFYDTLLTRTNFSEAHLAGARFSWGAGALTYTRFVHADLTGADLQGLSLTTVDFTDADLRGANLRDTDLRGAITTGANFDGADLTGARR